MFALPVIHVFDGKGECEIIPVSNFDLLYPGPFQHQLFIEGKHSTISYEDPNITAAQAREMQNSQKGQAYRRAKEEYECKRPAYETKRASNTGFFGIIKNFFLRPPKAPKPPVFYEFERNSYLRATGTFELSGWGTQSEIRQAKEISIPINSAEVTLRGQNGSRLVIEKFTNTQTVYIIPLGIFKRNLLNMSNHPVWSERVHLFFQGRRDSLLSATTTGWGQPRLEIRDDQGRIISPESFPFIHALYEHRDEVDRYLVFLLSLIHI